MATLFPKVVTSPYPRTRLPLFLYSMSILTSLFLIYWSGIYCNHNICNIERRNPSKHVLQHFPTIAAPIIMFISLSWLTTAFFYSNNSCTLTYNFMEMPSAVFCSLLGGVSAVIEIHFSVDDLSMSWSEQWIWSSISSVSLCLLHAMIAFALQ